MPKIALLTAPLLLTLPAALWASQDSGTADPQVCGTIRSVFAMTDAEAQAYQRQNLEHVKLGMSQVREHVAQLSQARRAELREATGYVVEHCPYTRATIELVQLMRDSAHEATAREAQATGCSAENAPLTLLVRTLDEHWALLEDIGATPPPVEGACKAGTEARFEALYATLRTVRKSASALDDDNKRAVESLLHEFVDDGGAIIFTTHESAQIVRMGAQERCIENGEVLALRS